MRYFILDRWALKKYHSEKDICHGAVYHIKYLYNYIHVLKFKNKHSRKMFYNVFIYKKKWMNNVTEWSRNKGYIFTKQFVHLISHCLKICFLN